MFRRLALTAMLAICAAPAFAHEIGGSDAAFVAAARGPEPMAFLYLGAKHMVTGYDHLLFLVGVIFYLRRLRQVALYVTLFSAGHSITLLAGVLMGTGIDARMVDAAIGLSVVWKAFDNLGGVRTLTGFQPDARPIVFGFGLVHGLGLATKLQALDPARDGLVANLVAFNVGVELGQLVALSAILAAMTLWRRTASFQRWADQANIVLMAAGFLLMGERLMAYALGGPA